MFAANGHFFKGGHLLITWSTGMSSDLLRFYNIYLLWNPCFLLFLLFLFFKWKYDTIVTLTATMAATMIVTVAVTATITEYLLLFYMKSLPHSLLMCLTYFLSFIPYHSNLTISQSTFTFWFWFWFLFLFLFDVPLHCYIIRIERQEGGI